MNDSTLIIVGVNHASFDKLWVGKLNEELNLIDERLFPIGDSLQELVVNDLIYRYRNGKLYAFGNGRIPGQAPILRILSACVNVQDSISLVNSHNTNFLGVPNDALFIDGEWKIFSSGFIRTDSLNADWTFGEPLVAGFSAGRYIVEVNDEFRFALGQTSTPIGPKYSGLIKKFNFQGETIAADTMFRSATQNGEYVAGKNSLLYNENRSSLYAIGTSGRNIFSGPFPQLGGNTTITNIRYDLDLNRVFTRTYGGDAFYNILNSTLLPNGNIASVGYRYYDETDVLEGILLITNGEHGATTATTFPGRRAAALPLSIVPNPITDRFVVETEAGDAQTYRLTVRDMTGRKVLERENVRTGEVVIPGDWPAGIYTVVLMDGERVIRSGKLVKQ